MIEVLIEGMTNNRGGKESYIVNIYNQLDKNRFNCSFIAYDDVIAYEAELKASGATIIHLPARSQGLIDHRKALNELFKCKHFDVVWAHKTTLSACEILEISKKHKVPLRIVHSHSSSNMGGRFTGIMHAINKRFIRGWANEYFACSETAAQWFYDDQPCKLMKNGIDVNKYSFNPKTRQIIREQLKLNHSFVIGHVGRFGIEKNHTKLILVFAELKKSNPDAKLVLCGDGEERENIQAQIREKGLENDVLMLGTVKNVHEILQAMDILIMPSLFEGLPFALLEAQTAGLKCVVSDTVSRESDIIGWNVFLPLTLGDREWADAILSVDLNYDRAESARVMRNAGYDVNACAECVMDIMEKAKAPMMEGH